MVFDNDFLIFKASTFMYRTLRILQQQEKVYPNSGNWDNSFPGEVDFGSVVPDPSIKRRHVVRSVYVRLPCVSPSPFRFRPSSDQTHRGGSHVCFALGTNFAATFRCKCPRPRPAPTHRREAVERSRARAGAEKESCSEVRTKSEGDVDSMCLTDNRHKRR